jgi:hypothetical protein
METPGDFRCTWCEAQFATWQELDDHRHSAHLVATPADGRSQAFASQPALDQHARDAHDVPNPEELEAGAPSPAPPDGQSALGALHRSA